VTTPATAPRICSRCRQRPASGKHRWCTRCKHGRGGPPAPEARTRPRRNVELNGGVNGVNSGKRSPGSAEYGPGTGRVVVEVADGQAPAKGHALPRSREQDAVGDATAHAATPPASLSLTTADLVSNATPAPPTGATMQTENVVIIITTQDDDAHDGAIPPRPSDDSFPPSLVGFVPLIPLPKKSEGLRGTEDQGPIVDIFDRPKRGETGPLCAAPLLVPIRTGHPNVVCVSCLAVGVRGELTEDHAIRLCPGGTVETLRWEPDAPRCALCWRPEDVDAIARPHPVGRRAFCERPDVVKVAAWHDCRWCGRRGGPFDEHHAEPVRPTRADVTA
jgi:hypothetical protein